MRNRTITAACLTVLSVQSLSAEESVPPCGLYLYKALIMRVVDGDTIVADIDLGFRTWLKEEHLRLHGIDAPERRTPEGDAVAERLRERIEGKTLFICTVKAKRSDREATGSFGRYLAVVYEDGENINDWLVETGQAAPYDR